MIFFVTQVFQKKSLTSLVHFAPDRQFNCIPVSSATAQKTKSLLNDYIHE